MAWSADGSGDSPVAQLWLRDGLDPDAPETFMVAVVVDPQGTPEERAVAELFSYGYEGDGTFLLVRTDGWAERRLDGDILTVDIVVYPAVLDQLDIDAAGFPERSPLEPDAIRLLRLSTRVARSHYEQAPDLTVVLTAPVDADNWPLILAPPPSAQP
jgi:hypothetical protein